MRVQYAALKNKPRTLLGLTGFNAGEFELLSSVSLQILFQAVYNTVLTLLIARSIAAIARL
jgi:hypothetical protein